MSSEKQDCIPLFPDEKPITLQELCDQVNEYAANEDEEWHMSITLEGSFRLAFFRKACGEDKPASEICANLSHDAPKNTFLISDQKDGCQQCASGKTATPPACRTPKERFMITTLASFRLDHSATAETTVSSGVPLVPQAIKCIELEKEYKYPERNTLEPQSFIFVPDDDLYVYGHASTTDGDIKHMPVRHLWFTDSLPS